MPLPVTHAQRVRLEALFARDREHDRGVHAAGHEHDGTREIGRHSHRPGSSPHSTLCNCIWKRTGTRASTIQSASSRGDTCAWLGENSTSHTACRRCSASTSHAQSKSAREQMTNFTWSCAVSSGRFSQRLRVTSPEPGVLMSDRKSTRLNSSHSQISYAVFCLKKKK